MNERNLQATKRKDNEGEESEEGQSLLAFAETVIRNHANSEDRNVFDEQISTWKFQTENLNETSHNICLMNCDSFEEIPDEMVLEFASLYEAQKNVYSSKQENSFLLFGEESPSIPLKSCLKKRKYETADLKFETSPAPQESAEKDHVFDPRIHSTLQKSVQFTPYPHSLAYYDVDNSQEDLESPRDEDDQSPNEIKENNDEDRAPSLLDLSFDLENHQNILDVQYVPLTQASSSRQKVEVVQPKKLFAYEMTPHPTKAILARETSLDSPEEDQEDEQNGMEEEDSEEMEEDREDGLQQSPTDYNITRNPNEKVSSSHPSNNSTMSHQNNSNNNINNNPFDEKNDVFLPQPFIQSLPSSEESQTNYFPSVSIQFLPPKEEKEEHKDKEIQQRPTTTIEGDGKHSEFKYKLSDSLSPEKGPAKKMAKLNSFVPEYGFNSSSQLSANNNNNNNNNNNFYSSQLLPQINNNNPNSNNAVLSQAVVDEIPNGVENDSSSPKTLIHSKHDEKDEKDEILKFIQENQDLVFSAASSNEPTPMKEVEPEADHCIETTDSSKEESSFDPNDPLALKEWPALFWERCKILNLPFPKDISYYPPKVKKEERRNNEMETKESGEVGEENEKKEKEEDREVDEEENDHVIIYWVQQNHYIKNNLALLACLWLAQRLSVPVVAMVSCAFPFSFRFLF
jgi:hypothetical protein